VPVSELHRKVHQGWQEIHPQSNYGCRQRSPIGYIYKDRVANLLRVVEREIKARGRHNKRIGNDLFNGRVTSCVTGRQQTITLEETRVYLRHLAIQRDDDLLLQAEHRIALDIPDFMGRMYRRSKWEEEDLATCVRAAAMAKPKRKMDPETAATMKANREAYLAEQKAAKAEAARKLAAQASALAQRMSKADPEEHLAIATRIAKLVGVEGMPGVLVEEAMPEPPEMCPLPPVVPENIDDEYIYQDPTSIDGPTLDVEALAI
jgi:hypothetical protein